MRSNRPDKTFTRQAALALATVVLVLPKLARCRHVWDDERNVPAKCRECGRTGYPTASMHDYDPD